jgi:hypothetical protein
MFSRFLWPSGAGGMDRTQFPIQINRLTEAPRGPEAAPVPGSVVMTGAMGWQHAGTAERRVIRVD